MGSAKLSRKALACKQHQIDALRLEVRRSRRKVLLYDKLRTELDIAKRELRGERALTALLLRLVWFASNQPPGLVRHLKGLLRRRYKSHEKQKKAA